MMVNTNMMLMVVLLWAGTLPVASPKNHRMLNKFWGKLDCEKYILPIHSIWAPRTSCEENKRVKCQSGYISKVQTTCKNGDWLLEDTCQAVECPRDEKIENSGDLTQSRKYKEELSFVCSPGYTGNGGTGILTCGEYNIWTENQACQGCLRGENITNSDDLTEASMLGGEFTFNCSAGYTFNGDTGILTCDEFGNWTEKQACEAGCPQGVNIYNSNDVTRSSKIGEQFPVNCLIGLIKKGVLTCGENGTWIVEAACAVKLQDNYVSYSLLPEIVADNCSVACAEDTTCGFAERVGNDKCQLYKKPIIYSLNKTPGILCKQKCKDDPRCLTYSWNYDEQGLCRLFNADYFTVASTAGFKIVYEKSSGYPPIIIEEKSTYWY